MDIKVGKCLVNSFDTEIAFDDVSEAKDYYRTESYDNEIEAKFNYDLNACETLEELVDVLNYYESLIFDQGATYYIDEVPYTCNGIRIA